MKPSQASLAEQIDGWVSAGKAQVSETAEQAFIRDLSWEDAQILLAMLQELAWEFRISDSSDEYQDVARLDAHFAPFSVEIAKPGHQGRTLLTCTALREFLLSEALPAMVFVARLRSPITTYGTQFVPWDWTELHQAVPFEARPRSIVKETGDIRRVVASLASWILTEGSDIDWNDPVARVWCERSAGVLLYSVSDEVEPAGSFIFRGPPTTRFGPPTPLTERWQKQGFLDLTRLVRWVYASPAEAESRRALVAAEICRTAFRDDDPVALAMAADRVLEGARIAHQLGLSKLSLDTLKAMTDLRKAVSDEATRLSEAVRQLANSVTGAVFTGVTVMAARLSLALSSTAFNAAVICIAVVLWLFVGAIVANGFRFLAIQKTLRQEWRGRLYRYLPEDEYNNLVLDPARSAENAFKFAAICALFIITVLVLVMAAVAFPETSRSWAVAAYRYLQSQLNLACS